MRYFRPSRFWHAAARLFCPSFLFSAAIMLVCLELVSRAAPIIVGQQVHQRYLYSTRICEMDCSNKGKRLTWIANGHGARGDLLHDEPITIAIFGSSTSEDALLDQEQTWAERLKYEIGKEVCHVDNFGRDNSYIGEATLILEEFERTGQRYDIALLQVIGNPTRRPASQRSAFHYSGDWPAIPRKLTLRTLLPIRLAKQAQSEPRLVTMYTAAHNALRPPPPRKHPPRNSRANRHLRATGQVRLVYQPRPLSAEDKDIVRRETSQLLEVARSVADHVFVIAQPVAYDQHEHPGVARKWFSLYPIPGRNAYYDNRSVAEWIREEMALIEDVAAAMGVTVIDVDSHLRPQLAARDDLFDDKWHYAPAGARGAAEFIADALGDVVQETLAKEGVQATSDPSNPALTKKQLLHSSFRG